MKSRILFGRSMRAILMSGACLGALSWQAAQAQQQAGTENGVEEVVVSGIRGSLQRNLDIKRVEADEIWAFCTAKDRNVPEGREDDENSSKSKSAVRSHIPPCSLASTPGSPPGMIAHRRWKCGEDVVCPLTW